MSFLYVKRKLICFSGIETTVGARFILQFKIFFSFSYGLKWALCFHILSRGTTSKVYYHIFNVYRCKEQYSQSTRVTILFCYNNNVNTTYPYTRILCSYNLPRRSDFFPSREFLLLDIFYRAQNLSSAYLYVNTVAKMSITTFHHLINLIHNIIMFTPPNIGTSLDNYYLNAF